MRAHELGQACYPCGGIARCWKVEVWSRGRPLHELGTFLAGTQVVVSEKLEFLVIRLRVGIIFEDRGLSLVRFGLWYRDRDQGIPEFQEPV